MVVVGVGVVPDTSFAVDEASGNANELEPVVPAPPLVVKPLVANELPVSGPEVVPEPADSELTP